MEETNIINEPAENMTAEENGSVTETNVYEPEVTEGEEVSEQPAAEEKQPVRIKIDDEERERNLQAKLQIIEELKQLVNKEESGGKTFQEFRALQERWRSIGQVPQARISDLWETFHLHVENFYNYIKINKELRDLDLKHNLEEKTALCEECEKLAETENAAEAFKILQTLHSRWKETGPVAKEFKEQLWERFKTATAAVNTKYHQYYDELRKQQEAAFALKEEFCKKAAEIADGVYSTLKEWQAATDKLLELQKEWKNAGEVALKDRNRIFKKFRVSCDKFFESKREFFKDVIEEQTKNLALKTALCEKVEALQNSEEWKTATEAIIEAQKEWKNIGAVAQKHSQKIWKRFRAACDVFFNRKSEHFKSIETEQSGNLEAKKAIIEELGNFELSENPHDDLAKLQEIQNRWNAVGYVPIKKKETLQEQFRNAINALFEKIDLPDSDKELEKFRNKVNAFDGNKDKNAYKIVNERDKLVAQIKQLETDINTQENNMGFLAASKNAEGFLAGLMQNLQKSKEKLALLKEKLKELDKII